MRNTRGEILAVVLGLAATAGSAAHANVMTFSDTEFLDTNWEIRANPQKPGTAYIMAGTGDQSTSGGNPGAFRHTNQFLQTNGILVVTHDYKTAYDPAAGAILSLDYAFDYKVYSSNEGITFFPALIQVATNGETQAYYALANAPGAPSDDIWRSFSTSGLTCSAFDQADGSSNPALYPPTLLGIHPDCSPSGGLLYFGFATYNYNAAANYQPSYNGGIDNWLVRVTNDAVSTDDVPEPAAMGLLALGALWVGAGHRRRCRNAA